MTDREGGGGIFSLHRKLLHTPRLDPALETDPLYLLNAERDILDTIYSYAIFYDAVDIASLVEIFTPDALFVDILGSFRGRTEIGDHFHDLTRGMTSALHLAPNPVIRLESHDRARAASFLFAIGARDGGEARATTGTYSDTLTRGSDGVWRIAERIIGVNMSFPLGNLPVEGAADALRRIKDGQTK